MVGRSQEEQDCRRVSRIGLNLGTSSAVHVPRSMVEYPGRFKELMTTNSPTLGRVILYVHDVPAVAEFYSRHFGFEIHQEPGDRIVELVSAEPSSGNIMLHPLGRGRKRGQALVKLVFDTRKVDAFCVKAKAAGLEFGPIHTVDGYAFANAKDPAGNIISVSSRAFRSST